MTTGAAGKSKAGRRAAMRVRRHRRIRRKVAGTSERPRLAVSRSLKHVTGQIIDDSRGVTLVGVCSSDPRLGPSEAVGGAAERAEPGAAAGVGAPGGPAPADGTKAARARAAGRALAERALAKGIARVVFDRGGYVYHGRIKAFAEGAREGGLQF